MRAGRIFSVLAVTVLAVGLTSGVADAGKKKTKKTKVIFFSGSPSINKSGKVTARGSLNTTAACKYGRGLRLQLTDASGAVLSNLDGATSDSNGNWVLSGKLPTLANGTYGIRAKATKAGTKKYVCKAGASAAIPFQIPLS
jgi:hypothetical protein